MAKISDRWHKSFPGSRDEPCGCSGDDGALYPATGHLKGDRWQVRWYDFDGKQRSQNFRGRSRAERHLAGLEDARCLVGDCGKASETPPPVLLCGEHLDIAAVHARRRRRPAHPSIVYFIRNGDRIKIGRSANLKGRMMQMAVPRDSVLLTIPGARKEEKALHYRFAAARVGRSEWFEATAELEEYIAQRLAEAA